MHRLLRYYSQNRMKIWTMILAIIFILVIIQVFNNIAKNEVNNKNKETSKNDVSYNNESKSIITQGEVSEQYQEGFGKIIDEFYTYCVNHEPQKAYELLAPDMKKVLYQSESQFENLYYKEKFEGNKQYSFQSWTRSADDKYIYQIQIYDDMLSTGKRSDEDYIEDYVTIVPVEDSYRLNINSYIGRKEIKKTNENELIKIEASTVDSYMDYEIYSFHIKNNTDNYIMLDTRKNTDTVFITDDKENKFESFLYENSEQDLIIKPKEAKTIQIKFSNSYRSNMKITTIEFTNIVNYEDYLQNDEVRNYSLKIEL